MRETVSNFLNDSPHFSLMQLRLFCMVDTVKVLKIIIS
jgi:hypothetical protein